MTKSGVKPALGDSGREDTSETQHPPRTLRRPWNAGGESNRTATDDRSINHVVLVEICWIFGRKGQGTQRLLLVGCGLLWSCSRQVPSPALGMSPAHMYGAPTISEHWQRAVLPLPASSPGKIRNCRKRFNVNWQGKPKETILAVTRAPLLSKGSHTGHCVRIHHGAPQWWPRTGTFGAAPAPRWCPVGEDAVASFSFFARLVLLPA